MALIMANGLTAVQVNEYLKKHVLSRDFEAAIAGDISLWALIWRGALKKRCDEFHWRAKR